MEKFDFSKIEEQKRFDNLPEEERKKIIDAAKREAAKIIEKIKFGEAKDYEEAEKLIINKEPKEIILTPKQQSAKQGMIECLLKGWIDNAIKIKNEFALPEEIMSSKEIQLAAKQRMIKCLSAGWIGDALKIKNEFSLPEEIVQSVAKQRMIECLSAGSISNALKIKNEFSLPEEIVQSVVKQRMIERLSEGLIGDALKIKNEFSLPEEIMSSKEIQQSAKQGMIECLLKGWIDNAIKIKNEFALPEEIAQQSAKQGMIECLLKGWIGDAIKIKNKFALPISSQEIIDEVPKLNKLLTRIKSVSSKFYVQALKSVDVTISLLEYKNNPDQFFEIIKENPFLLDAISENTKFGSKLLLKFPQLDELSQRNIEFLFDAKKEILKENPDIDIESLEFRQLMQERLKKYESNPKILAEIKKSGVNVEQWLNYQDTRYFSLESGKSNLAFSETVSMPLNRIKETIGSYSYLTKEVLKEYKKELSEYRIPIEDPEKIEDKIAQMRLEMEKDRNEGNENKAQGVQKGIDGLTQKLANLKTVSSWDKILGDINAFSQLKTDVFKAQEDLIKAESEFAEKVSGKTPSGKEIQDAKRRIVKAKEELKLKFDTLEKRIEDFKTNMPEILSPILGEDRTKALTQEIEMKLAEQFDHWDTDKRDLANIFSERGDNEKRKMENQPMSIFVWVRNPDIDLYQGNYSDCCIKINSEHMGAESTIADYNTDLGIQIVNIWDETKNEPVTAAWCWLGKSEDGKTALVVDNIEAYPAYKNAYPEQLSRELLNYIKEYGTAIKVDKIVLGMEYNDLPTAGEINKMEDDDSGYSKIGGYNRDDEYHFDVKESDRVKLIWEANKKLKKKQKIIKHRK